MVLTEILQNALEHGFREGETGTVEVSAVRGGTSKEARLLVTVQDDGVGLPRDSTRTARATSACRSYGRWWRASWAAPSTWWRHRSGGPG